jgi:hypothetical protein
LISHVGIRQLGAAPQAIRKKAFSTICAEVKMPSLNWGSMRSEAELLFENVKPSSGFYLDFSRNIFTLRFVIPIQLRLATLTLARLLYFDFLR